jgi:hypothetical protein
MAGPSLSLAPHWWLGEPDIRPGRCLEDKSLSVLLELNLRPFVIMLLAQSVYRQLLLSFDLESFFFDLYFRVYDCI